MSNMSHFRKLRKITLYDVLGKSFTATDKVGKRVFKAPK